MTFDPGERHSVRGLDDARLLLMLSPWPAPGNNGDWDAQHSPVNATVEPISGS